MQLKLKIFLIILCLIFDLIVYKKVIDKRLQMKYCISWFITTFILIFITVFDRLLIPIRNFFGFETSSNMIFLIGFIMLTLLIFNQNIKISENNNKIIKLTQELAILKKEKSNEKNN